MLDWFKRRLDSKELEEVYPKSVWGGMVRHYRDKLVELGIRSNPRISSDPDASKPGSAAEAWAAASLATVYLYGRLLPNGRAEWFDQFEGRKNEISLSLSLIYPIFTAFSDGLSEERRVRHDEMGEHLKSTMVSAVTGSWPLFSPEQHVQLAERAIEIFSQAVDHPNGLKFLDEVKLAATLWSVAASENELTAMSAVEGFLANKFVELCELRVRPA